MDFSKYNKGLRIYAALFDLNPDIFNTKQFVDIVVFNKSCSIGILYNSLYDEYIRTEIEQNKHFFNMQFVKYKNGKNYYSYILSLTEDDDILNFGLISSLGSRAIHASLYIKLCITWKKYLNDSFYECLNYEGD